MTYRKLDGNASLLRVYITDFDKYQHHELYRAIVELARSSGLAGATAYRGLWGYGASGYVHTDVILEGAGERSLRIDIVDTQEHVRNFAKLVLPMLEKAGGLMTEKEIHVHQYQSSVTEDHDDGAQPSIPDEELNMKRELNGEQILLRIYIGELDKIAHKPLFQVILEKSKELETAGCTIFRGVAGFGASSVIHEGHLLRLSQDLPVILEFVDTQEKIHGLLKEIRPMLDGALVTEEKVIVHHYEAGTKTA